MPAGVGKKAPVQVQTQASSEEEGEGGLGTATTGAAEDNIGWEHNVTVIYVLGPPAAGKGTLCTALAHNYGLLHLCIGDLLRAVRDGDPESAVSKEIDAAMRGGKLVTADLAVGVLRREMGDMIRKEKRGGGGGGGGGGRGELGWVFLLDGYPRDMGQMWVFERQVCKSKYTLHLTADPKILLHRLLERASYSKRVDDTEEIFMKRWAGFEEHDGKIIEGLVKRGEVIEEVDCNVDLSEAYEQVRKFVENKLGLRLVVDCKDVARV